MGEGFAPPPNGHNFIPVRCPHCPKGAVHASDRNRSLTMSCRTDRQSCKALRTASVYCADLKGTSRAMRIRASIGWEG